MNPIVNSVAITFCFFLSIYSLTAQSKNWYEEDRTSEKPYSLNLNKVYTDIINDKVGTPVVVAVIDSGVDIEHEDLEDVIWVNYDEIPNNGIDDDNNGYIDDIHGWNFLGGKDGSQVGAETFEMVRIYRDLKKKYNDRDPNTLTKKELEEYNLFNEYGKKIESEVAAATKLYSQFESESQVLTPSIALLEKLSQQQELGTDLIDSLSSLGERTELIAANILNYFDKERDQIPNIDIIKSEILSPIQEAMTHYGNQINYHYNPDYDSRSTIVGDNINDVHERYYGNNMVEGPDAMHGTHVSGIIAAERDNTLGINGISNNTRIMVLRAVPDGDERDKDVANAIKYAVENGASIINMSFGKGQSPNKQVVDDAVRYAEKHDVLMVHAAGNSGADLDVTKNYPNDHFEKPKGFLFWKKKKAKNWISIGASGPSSKEDMVASFSNYGKNDVDVFAPGVMMYSSVPNNRYQISQGTSMAAPVITGVAALIRSYYPTLTAEQVRDVLIESTTPIETLVTKPGTSELVPFSSLSQSGGIIDVAGALTLAAKTKGKKKIKKSIKERA